MRAFEIALVVICGVLLLRPFLRALQRRFWTAALLVLSASVAVLHLILEGYRWQMVPAYILAGLVSVVALPSLWRSSTEPAMPKLWAKVLGGLGLLPLAIAVALPALFPIFRFPQPTGPYRVGTVIYHWTDTQRDEPFTEDPSDHRELMVQVWYPVDGTVSGKPAPYAAHPEIVGRILAQRFGLPGFVFDHLRYIRTNALFDVGIASSGAPYPVILFSHGGGGLRIQNTFQGEDLVSHGYVVAGLDHTYAAAVTVFPDGRAVPLDNRLKDRSFLDPKLALFAGDARFVLDQLESLNGHDPAGRFQGRLDVDRVGIFGHSLGGPIAALTCMLDARFAAGINIDAFVPQEAVEHGLARPFMSITRDRETMEQELAGKDPHELRVLVDEQMGSIDALSHGTSSAGYLVAVHGLYHYNATDLPLWTPLTAAIRMAGPIDTARAHEIVNAYTLAFFDRYLKELPAPLLESLASPYPEVDFAATGQ